MAIFRSLLIVGAVFIVNWLRATGQERSTAITPRATTSQVIYQSRFGDFENAWRSVTRSGIGTGQTRPMVPAVDDIFAKLNAQLAPLFEDHNPLIEIVSDTLQRSRDTAQYVAWQDWGPQGPPIAEGQQFISLEPSAGSYLGMYFVGPFGVAFRLHFVPAVSQADGDKIMRKYRELLAPQVRELTEQTFTENYEKAMVAAKRAQDGAEQRLHDLEEQRRQRKIRCYELMPIEDPRDYLADLLRQEGAGKRRTGQTANSRRH